LKRLPFPRANAKLLNVLSQGLPLNPSLLVVDVEQLRKPMQLITDTLSKLMGIKKTNITHLELKANI
jgi:hypothetical protein